MARYEIVVEKIVTMTARIEVVLPSFDADAADELANNLVNELNNSCVKTEEEIVSTFPQIQGPVDWEEDNTEYDLVDVVDCEDEG